MLRLRPVRAFALVPIFALLAIFSVASVSATPAEVTNYRSCYPDGDNTICYTIHDVTKSSNGSASHGTEVGTFLIEYFDPNGDLLWSSKTRWHTTKVVKNGEYQVYHDQVRATYAYNGQTCTAVQNVTFANGEIRSLGPDWEWTCK